MAQQQQKQRRVVVPGKGTMPLGIPHRRMRKIKHRVDSTPGKVKGPSCRAKPMARTAARRSRSYRWRGRWAVEIPRR